MGMQPARFLIGFLYMKMFIKISLLQANFYVHFEIAVKSLKLDFRIHSEYKQEQIHILFSKAPRYQGKYKQAL